MRLVDKDGNSAEIEDLTPDDVLDIVRQYEVKISVLQQRIHDLEGDVDYYTGELARAAW
jgi:hypothetical protein